MINTYRLIGVTTKGDNRVIIAESNDRLYCFHRMTNTALLQPGVYKRMYIRNMSLTPLFSVWGGRVWQRYCNGERPARRYKIKSVKIGDCYAHDSKPRRVFKCPDYIRMSHRMCINPWYFTNWRECIATMKTLNNMLNKEG